MEWRQQELLAAWVGAESQEGIDVEAVALLVGGLHFLEVLGRARDPLFQRRLHCTRRAVTIAHQAI